MRQSAGDGAATEVSVEPHPLHGLIVRAHVPKARTHAVSQALAAFTFRSDIFAIEEDT